MFACHDQLASTKQLWGLTLGMIYIYIIFIISAELIALWTKRTKRRETNWHRHMILWAMPRWHNSLTRSLKWQNKYRKTFSQCSRTWWQAGTTPSWRKLQTTMNGLSLHQMQCSPCWVARRPTCTRTEVKHTGTPMAWWTSDWSAGFKQASDLWCSSSTQTHACGSVPQLHQGCARHHISSKVLLCLNKCFPCNFVEPTILQTHTHVYIYICELLFWFVISHPKLDPTEVLTSSAFSLMYPWALFWHTLPTKIAVHNSKFQLAGHKTPYI